MFVASMISVNSTISLMTLLTKIYLLSDYKKHVSLNRMQNSCSKILSTHITVTFDIRTIGASIHKTPPGSLLHHFTFRLQIHLENSSSQKSFHRYRFISPC